MVLGNGIGNFLHEERFTCLGLCHDKGALSLADRRKEVHNAARQAVTLAIAEAELLLGEERCKVLEGYAVANVQGVTAIDTFGFYEDEVFLARAGNAHAAFNHVTGFKVEIANDAGADVNVVG